MTHKPKLVAVTGLSKNAGASTLAAGLAETLSDTSEGKVLLVDKPVAPKRFYDMLSEFKAGELDYVVFDMPSLGDTSSTLPMASFMDKVLLVVEAEKSNSESIKRAYSQLVAKADVSVIFNKSRSYGPKWLEGEI
jgi:Mrp family chromosome partitioning ATPase